MRHRLLATAIIALGTFDLACTTVPVVYKPEVDTVKDIAFVSLHANPVLANEDGERSTTAEVSSWANRLGVSGEKTAANSVTKALDFGGTRLVEHAYKSASRQLAGINGWKFAEPRAYAAKPEMQAFVTAAEERHKAMAGKLMTAVSGPQSVRHPGLAGPTNYQEPEDEAKAMKALLAKLDASAAALMNLRFTYDGNTTIGGTGSANLIVKSSLEVVNGAGQRAVKVNVTQRSKETVPMIAGNIAFTAETEALLKDTIDQSIAVMKEKILKEI